MIRFLSYVCLLIVAGANLCLIVRWRLKVSPRIMARIPPLALTILYGLYMAGRAIIFWADGHWFQNPPLLTLNAIIVNALVLAWVTTELIITIDWMAHHNG